MNDLTPRFEREAGQVIIEGVPAGVAGAASVVPVQGLELAFDRVDGRLCRAVADTRAPDGPVAFDEQVAAMLIRLFGPRADVVREDSASQESARPLCPEPGLTGALSSLALLAAARITSPVASGSPWWAAEAAVLAGQAGLAGQAREYAREALPGLLRQLASQERAALPESALSAARQVADGCAVTEPEASGQLLAAIGTALGRAPLPLLATARPAATLNVAGELALLEEERLPVAGLHWLLDPAYVPTRLFRFALTPWTDVFVRRKGRKGEIVVVGATLAPGAAQGALDRCVARLVDPAARRIIAQGRFSPAGSWALAELGLAYPPDELAESWIEVVDDKARPVLSTRSHRASRARRWADAALRAGRAPVGIDPRAAPGDWAALATAAWDRCRQDWAAAGDASRAAEAGRQQVAAAGTAAPRPGGDRPCYLAEIVGH
jgi:hypothetical protein